MSFQQLHASIVTGFYISVLGRLCGSFQLSLESNIRPRNFALFSILIDWLYKERLISRDFRCEKITATVLSNDILNPQRLHGEIIYHT